MLFGSQACIVSGRQHTCVVVPIRWGATVWAGGCGGCCRSAFGRGLSLCLRVSVSGSVTRIDFGTLSGLGDRCRLVFACRFCRRVVVAFGSEACHVVPAVAHRSLLIMLRSWRGWCFLLGEAIGRRGSVCPVGCRLLALAAPSPCCWLHSAVMFVVVLWVRWQRCLACLC